MGHHIKLFHKTETHKERERALQKMPNMTGIKLADSCLATFEQQMKLEKRKFVIFKLNADQTQIVPDEAVEEKNLRVNDEDEARKQVFDNFTELLPEDGCRYAIFNASYKQSGTYGNDAKRSKYMF